MIYQDLWKTKTEKRNAIQQGIISTDGCTENCIKSRINEGDKNAGNARDKAIADTYGNKFIIPLDFEMLDSAAPYYQAGLGNRLSYEITFNDYNRVTKSGVSSPKVPDATYKITDISLEYEIVTQPDLSRSIRSEYLHMTLLYDRILRHRKIIVNKSDTVWKWALTGILVLFEEEKSYIRDTSKFDNPKIQKVSVIVEGKPNQLYAQGMRSFEQYDEARKYFAEGRLANEVQAQLQLYDVSLGEYLVNKYALWLDFRTTDENELHGTGRRVTGRRVVMYYTPGHFCKSATGCVVHHYSYLSAQFDESYTSVQFVENCTWAQFDSNDLLEPFESIFIGSTVLAMVIIWFCQPCKHFPHNGTYRVSASVS